ncbi:MAG TPA: glycosyltransferase family 39 protein [Thermoanaerobaculia bacterium]|nr:glycosyltransferase family 39 protein [Thermoanaerobaculia bacterium]
MRRLLAAASFLLSLALFGLAMTPFPRLHAFLSARAGHSVTAGYVERVHVRAIVCGAVALLVACGVLVVRIPPVPQKERLDWPIGPVPAAIIAIGAIARALLLRGPPHYDEVFTVTEFASHSPLFFLTRYTHANNHVFHTLLVWIVRAVAGQRLWAVRIPAFVAGIAVLYAVYLLSRRLSGATAALIALALAAGATPLVEYSAQARGYTILTAVFLLLYLIDDDRLRAVLIALGAWTVPTMLYAAAAWALWSLATERNWQRLTFVAAAGGALTFVLYLPIIVVTGTDSITANGNTLSVSYPVLFRELPRTFVEMASEWTLSFTWGIGIFLAIAAIVAIIRRDRGGLALGFAVAAIVPLLLVMRKVPFARVWLFVLPLALIAAATTIASMLPRLPRAVPVVIAAVVAANAVRLTARDAFVDDPAMYDVAEVSDVIRTLPPDARVLVTTPLDAPFAFYLPPERIIQDRFDSDPAAVRAAVLAAPRRFFAATNEPASMSMYAALHLPLRPVAVRRFAHTTLFELRSDQ